MYKFLLILSAVVLLVYFTFTPHAPIRHPIKSQACNNLESLKHVYRPWRLIVHNQCITVRGFVRKVIKEPDGDYHIRLEVDRAFRKVLNFGNQFELHGDLVLEPVCVHETKHDFEEKACKDYTSNVLIPNVGDHIAVTGQYVTDIMHFWREIHPVYEIIRQ